LKRRKDAHRAKDISAERIERLFQMASDEYALHPERSDRYVEIARKICTRTRLRMPRQFKRMVCKHCGKYLPAAMRRVRLRDGVLTVTCLKCGEQMRYPYIEKTCQNREDLPEMPGR
jgi:ribonuclease P protein subunit RPR2